MKQKPVVIDLELAPKAKRVTPAQVPPVPEKQDIQNSAMQTVTRQVGRKGNGITRLFLWVLIALAGFIISVAFWDFVAGMMERNLWMGRAALTVTGLLLLGVLFFALRELAAFARLQRMDRLRSLAATVYVSDDLRKAQGFSVQLERIYRGRQDLRWAFAKVSEQGADIVDTQAYMTVVENTVVTQLDGMAVNQIEAAARQVATATALIPLALADVAIALTANIRMIRRIAQIYGGRSGTFGSWRLLRVVAAHLVATGAVAIGDDMIGSIAGGSVISKLSRRFGEGIINGALTARVGVAAMEVCRPMPFRAVKKPSVTGMMKRALAGFVGKGA